MIEIERKFLVTDLMFQTAAVSKKRIVQGFLNKDPERTVRVRIKEELGFLTIKGKSNASGTSRYEWEREVPIEEARALMALCEAGTIDKIRYEVPVGDHIFEVDEFLGDNLGLTVAEVELTTENETFVKPDWLGVEVTGDPRYYNSQLSERPFTIW